MVYRPSSMVLKLNLQSPKNLAIFAFALDRGDTKMSPLFILQSPETMEAVIEKLEGLLAEWLAPHPDHFLVDIKWLPGNKMQVFLDAEHGIKIETCVEVSRYLEKHIDEGGWLGEKYILEVSSPGMDSPLKVLRQYQRRLGRELSVVKTDGVKIEGTLKQFDEQGLELESVKMVKGKVVETNLHQIPFTDIKTAKLKFNF